MRRVKGSKQIPPARRAFCERLGASRVAAGYDTQKDFADKIGVEHERYRMWERGDREPDLTHLVKIAIALQTSLDFLLLGKTPTDRHRRAASA
jgi:transcriptional regulator with XRE-family HTH domain